MAKGQKKTGGRQKGSRNKRTQEREEATAQAIALIGEAIPDAFAGDAHAFLVAVYKNPKIDHHTRQDAAKAALAYEKPRLKTVTVANERGEPPKMRSELDIGRRLAFVLELIARGEVKVKMPKGAPLLDGLEVPERHLAGREFAISQIASHCVSSKIDENRERKTEPAVGTGEEEKVPDRCEPALLRPKPNACGSTGIRPRVRYLSVQLQRCAARIPDRRQRHCRDQPVRRREGLNGTPGRRYWVGYCLVDRTNRLS